MTLQEILRGVQLRRELSEDSRGIEVTGLEYDSRRVEAGFLFFAFPGARADGREFARPAMEKGAVAVASDLEPPEDFEGTWIGVEHGRRAPTGWPAKGKLMLWPAPQ